MTALLRQEGIRMVATQFIARRPVTSTKRQRLMRRRLRGLPLKQAVRRAIDRYFDFRSRTVEGKALWSETEHVWLGSATFLHWAMWLKEINIPWIVAATAGAPLDSDKLRGAVLAELLAYWADRISALPCRAQPHWLPLP
jgi:hypothetical protein